jgi:hypothetical protein
VLVGHDMILLNPALKEFNLHTPLKVLIFDKKNIESFLQEGA